MVMMTSCRSGVRLCYVMLCYVMLCYVMLCYVMLCYVMLCYVMLCLRNRKHFPCFYRVIETRVEVWEKREIAWEHEHEVRVFPRNFEFLPNFHKCFYNSIGTRKMFSISFIK